MSCPYIYYVFPVNVTKVADRDVLVNVTKVADRDVPVNVTKVADRDVLVNVTKVEDRDIPVNATNLADRDIPVDMTNILYIGPWIKISSLVIIAAISGLWWNFTHASNINIADSFITQQAVNCIF